MDTPSNKLPTIYRDLFDKNPQGLAVLDHLYQMFYDVETFDKDSLISAYKQGQRSVIRFIMLQRDRLEREQFLKAEQEQHGDNE